MLGRWVIPAWHRVRTFCYFAIDVIVVKLLKQKENKPKTKTHFRIDVLSIVS